MEKIAAFIIWFIIWGGITIAILYLIEFGFTNPLYIDWKSHLSFFIFPTILGLIGAKAPAFPSSPAPGFHPAHQCLRQ